MDLDVQAQPLMKLDISLLDHHGAPGTDYYHLAGLHLMPSSLCSMEKHITNREGTSRSYGPPCHWKHVPAEPVELA